MRQNTNHNETQIGDLVGTVTESINEFNQYRAEMNERILSGEHLGIKRFFAPDHQAYEGRALDSKTRELITVPDPRQAGSLSCPLITVPDPRQAGSLSCPLITVPRSSTSCQLVVPIDTVPRSSTSWQLVDPLITVPRSSTSWQLVVPVDNGAPILDKLAACRAH